MARARESIFHGPNLQSNSARRRSCQQVKPMTASVDTLLRRAYEARYGEAPRWVARAPGRVNLIGEHTDYNDGFVLPMAIDRAIWIALRPRRDRRVRLYSLEYDQTGEFDIDRVSHTGEGWLEYVKGVAWALQEGGHALEGFEGVLAGDLPIGAGLSSSAALELAAARAFTASAGGQWDPASMALLGKRVENEWLGVQSGVMDQMISARGRDGHALLLDCRSLEGKLVPLPPQIAVVILDTGTRRALVESAYNERREQCQAAVHFFGVDALRDVSLQTFAGSAAQLDPLTRRRARHVISENERTLQAAEAMRAGDAPSLGTLMDASHASLRDDFEVSSPALDRIVELARAQPGCYGARMTGAGFGGCAVALIEAQAAHSLTETVAPLYQESTGHTPQVYRVWASDGAGLAPDPA